MKRLNFETSIPADYKNSEHNIENCANLDWKSNWKVAKLLVGSNSLVFIPEPLGTKKYLGEYFCDYNTNNNRDLRWLPDQSSFQGYSGCQTTIGSGSGIKHSFLSAKSRAEKIKLQQQQQGMQQIANSLKILQLCKYSIQYPPVEARAEEEKEYKRQKGKSYSVSKLLRIGSKMCYVLKKLTAVSSQIFLRNTS